MNTERIAAQQLASYGRFGDTMLLHVNPLEVQGIASLIPGGLTTNPVTGLPEAFFFLPFLASMFSAAAPAAAAATAGAAGAAAAGGALASGLAAGAGAAGAAGLASAAAPSLLSTLGAGAMTPALTAGTGMLASAAPAAGTLAAAAPLTGVTGGIGSLLGTAGGAGAAGATTAASLPAAASLASAAPLTGTGGIGSLLGGPVADAVTTGSIVGPGAPLPSLAGSSVLGGANTGLALPPPTIGSGIPVPPAGPPAPPPAGGTVLSGPKTGLPPVGPPAPSLAGQTVLAGPKTGLTVPNAAAPPGGSMFSKLGDYFMKNPMMLAMAAQGIGGLLKKGPKKEKSNYKKGSYKGGAPVPAPAGHDPGLYEHNYFPNMYTAYANNGGLIGYAAGGPVDPQAQMPQDMGFPLNGVPAGGIADLVPEDIPTSEFPTEQIGTDPEAAPVDGDNDQELVMQMVEVIQGKHPDPEPVIKAFVQEFGEEALQDLAQRVKATMGPQGGPPPGGPPPGRQMGPPPPNPMDQMGPMPPMPPMAMPQMANTPQGFAYGGAVGGRGDGLSDSVPAMIDGRQPAALSRGEFVVPADAVSGLGNGSTDAGAEQLQGMVNNVRMARGGQVGQPPPLQGGIAAMMGGGLVQGYKKGGKVKVRDDDTGSEDEISDEEIITQWREIGTDPRSSRMDKIWAYANRPKVIPDGPYSQEWSDNVGAWQDANRYLLENNIK